MDKKLVNKYRKLSNEDIKKEIKTREDKIDFWFYNSKSWEEYLKETKIDRNEVRCLYTAQILNTPYEDIELKKFDNLDKKCLMKIDDFIYHCKIGFFTTYDGSGVYATSTHKTDLNASPDAFKDDLVRNDFTHVCWYNK